MLNRLQTFSPSWPRISRSGAHAFLPPTQPWLAAPAGRQPRIREFARDCTSCSPSSYGPSFFARTQTTACSKSRREIRHLLRRLAGQGKITEKNIEEALRDVRLALLEPTSTSRRQSLHRRGQARAAPVRRCSGPTPEQHFLKLSTASSSALLGEQPVRSISAAARDGLHARRLKVSGRPHHGQAVRGLRVRSPSNPVLLGPADVVYRARGHPHSRTLAASSACLDRNPVGGRGRLRSRSQRDPRPSAGRRGACYIHPDRHRRSPDVDERLMDGARRDGYGAVEPRHVILVADAMTRSGRRRHRAGFAARLRSRRSC